VNPQPHPTRRLPPAPVYSRASTPAAADPATAGRARARRRLRASGVHELPAAARLHPAS
jgi:hypothetical protein